MQHQDQKQEFSASITHTLLSTHTFIGIYFVFTTTEEVVLLLSSKANLIILKQLRAALPSTMLYVVSRNLKCPSFETEIELACLHMRLKTWLDVN